MMNDNMPLAAREMRWATARLHGEQAAGTIMAAAEISRACGIEWPAGDPDPIMHRMPPPHDEPLQDREVFTREFNAILPGVRPRCDES